ncbi:MAG: 50S ribosomal protein L35 [Candidatus Pacebacteria bacterium]|nr:50S ribosomal protein L35 [Candidatus Paceibacterota bacterium]
MKTNKSFTKRLRVTRKGKIVARAPGNNHFNAKRSSKIRLQKGRPVDMKMSNVLRSRFLPNTPNV